MNPILKFALGLANVPDQDVADLEKSLPALGRLIAGAKDMKADLESAGPHIQAMEPHIDALLPIAERLLPKVKVLWPDLVAVWPVMQEFEALAQK